MISGSKQRDVSSFFWRQVVAQSPMTAKASKAYELGWNAINDLIRSDWTWSGYERNVFYVNNRDGTFSDVSGAAGLDFQDDSRAFALADYDHDGRLEVFLKNRTGPQVRVLRNDMSAVGGAISFRLRGRQSNRDAIGAMIEVESAGLRQLKFVQAGSGFLAQHTKEIFFGLGTHTGEVHAKVRWPNGLVQQFDHLEPGHRIEIEEGATNVRSSAFTAPRRSPAAPKTASEPPPRNVETWLLEPLTTPAFSLSDTRGGLWTLERLSGRPALLTFCSSDSLGSGEQLRAFQAFSPTRLQLLALIIGDGPQTLGRFARASFPILIATPEVVGTYNILFRYLYDRRRNLALPTSLLLDDHGAIVKVYQGVITLDQIIRDSEQIPWTVEQRTARALPFAGVAFDDYSHRNYFTYGVAFSQNGYVEPAIAFFELALRRNPDYAEAHYNVGTLYLQKGSMEQAGVALERAVELRPNYPEALNNLGMLAAKQGQTDKAINYFLEVLRQDPEYSITLVNLGNIYRRQGRLPEAQVILERALTLDAADPEALYGLGMLFAQEGDEQKAHSYLEQALQLRPDDPQALNNLGVLDVHMGRLDEALKSFQACLRVSPSFDQPYLNLAHIYVAMNQPEAARRILLQLLERSPDHVLARKALEQLHR
jgi:tetratricopeptide (TPR) repeat protein